MSQETREGLLALPFASPDRLEVIVNGCAPALESPTGREPKPANGELWLVNVARLNEVKDQATLLEAFAIARKDAPALRLAIVGDGPARAKLEALTRDLSLSNDVVLAGAQQYVGDWLRGAAAFVMSSLSEGTPVALLEAMAAGLPAIVTSVGEMPSIVGDAACGIIVPPRSPARLAAAMLEIAHATTARREELARNARRAWEEHYAAKAMFERYEAVYRSALR